MDRFTELFRVKNASPTLPHLHDNAPNFTAPSLPARPRQVQLDIVTGGRCPICQAAAPLIEQFRRDMPNVQVRVIDIDVPGTPVPHNVIAIPTILINGYIVATGNPAYEELKEFVLSLS